MMTKEQFLEAWKSLVISQACGGRHAPERERACGHDHARSLSALAEGDVQMAVAIYNGWAEEPIRSVTD